jgi:hypothetical protein
MAVTSQRLALACALGASLAAASYAIQHLVGVWTPADDGSIPIAQEHIPFFWRCGLSVWHGLIGGTLVWLGVERVPAWLERSALVLPLLLIPLMLLMLAVPA